MGDGDQSQAGEAPVQIINEHPNMSDFPDIKSKHSLVAKHVTKPIWEKLSQAPRPVDSLWLKPLPVLLNLTISTAASMLVIGIPIRCLPMCSTQSSKNTMASPLTLFTQVTWMLERSKETLIPLLPFTPLASGLDDPSMDLVFLLESLRSRELVLRTLLKKAFANLTGDLAGSYYPLTGMSEKVRQQLVDDHFLFMSGDPNLKVAGMERDWPEGRGIFHNKD